MNELTPPPAVVARLEELARLAGELADEGIAPSTRRAYARAWRQWIAWCEARTLSPLPADPAAVAAWIADQVESGAAISSVAQRLAAVAVAHRAAGHLPPTHYPQVRAVLRGARRRVGTAPKRPTEPAMIEELRQMIAACPLSTRAGLRDRAVLLVGFAGAFRRSELVGLEVRDLRASAEGLTVTLRRSKTDQEASGRVIGIPRARRSELSPVAAVAAWLAAAGIVDGPIFRSVDRHDRVAAEGLDGGTVARIVQRAAARAGLDAARLAAHSLRRGFATEAAAAGATEAAIMRQTGHKSVITVRGYIREGSVFLDNAAARLL